MRWYSSTAATRVTATSCPGAATISGTYRTVCGDLGIDDVIAHVLQGWRPRNISERYLTRLVLAAGQGVRASQRKVSKRTIGLLGADPTRPWNAAGDALRRSTSH